MIPKFSQSPIASPALAHIQLLTDQLDELYQSMHDERRAIAQWGGDQEFSILGVLELFPRLLLIEYMEMVAIAAVA
jgi:hypothetical protein